MLRSNAQPLGILLRSIPVIHALAWPVSNVNVTALWQQLDSNCLADKASAMEQMGTLTATFLWSCWLYTKLTHCVSHTKGKKKPMCYKQNNLYNPAHDPFIFKLKSSWFSSRRVETILQRHHLNVVFTIAGMFRISKGDSPICALRGVTADADRLLWYCPRYRIACKPLVGSTGLTSSQFNFWMRSVLKLLTEKGTLTLIYLLGDRKLRMNCGVRFYFLFT